MNIEILYSDPNLLAVNKPSGLLTIPDGYHPELPCAVRLLQASQGRLWVVHRLDKDTSGVLLFARNALTHKILNEQFQNRQVHKIYRAIIAGSPEWEQEEIDLPLKVNGDRQHRTRVNLAGQQTRPNRYSPDHTLPRLFFRGGPPPYRLHPPDSGPSIGDRLSDRFGSFVRPALVGSPVTLLLAWGCTPIQISFLLPDAPHPVSLVAPYPPDFQAALTRLA